MVFRKSRFRLGLNSHPKLCLVRHTFLPNAEGFAEEIGLPILDIFIRFGDIRGQTLNLFKIEPGFCFPYFSGRVPPNFWI